MSVPNVPTIIAIWRAWDPDPSRHLYRLITSDPTEDPSMVMSDPRLPALGSANNFCGAGVCVKRTAERLTPTLYEVECLFESSTARREKKMEPVS